jgi:hypothetical protein
VGVRWAAKGEVTGRYFLAFFALATVNFLEENSLMFASVIIGGDLEQRSEAVTRPGIFLFLAVLLFSARWVTSEAQVDAAVRTSSAVRIA